MLVYPQLDLQESPKGAWRWRGLKWASRILQEQGKGWENTPKLAWQRSGGARGGDSTLNFSPILPVLCITPGQAVSAAPSAI